MSSSFRFPLGQVVAAPGALALLQAHAVSPAELLARHQAGDWGEVPPDDAQANELAVAHGDRLLSCYRVGGERLWIITEADRAATTLLLPSEY